ncbi:uncharacterized protein TA11865 [Theileria annulata]|uniref:Adenylate kinase isoenzyme 6 homolog n=1 Tax=Theileria annulata TaxID=5874 RepID=Q4UDQ4_THEAN|nr:uncharacterized protein TA11865 [Theileria annulata]CAI74785.1 hypothetical protein, conserved [Theileria annulata]|eukprot:XP_952517.1 hypothetical protein, conserved [Theileria annulata]
MVMEVRRIPNVLVVGTPGCGKSTLCNSVLKRLDDLSSSKSLNGFSMTHLNIANLIKDKNLYYEWDDEMDCSVYDEELLAEELSSYDFSKGGFLVEFHSVEFFEKSQFDCVYVLLTEIEILARRLEARDYTESKVKQNLQCEIFQTCLYDAYEVFGRSKVKSLNSNTEHDLENNTELLFNYLTNSS